MMKTLFDSVLPSFTVRITRVEKSAQSKNIGQQFTQKDIFNPKHFKEVHYHF